MRFAARMGLDTIRYFIFRRSAGRSRNFQQPRRLVTATAELRSANFSNGLKRAKPNSLLLSPAPECRNIFREGVREEARNMHLFHLSADFLHHLLGRETRIGELSFGIAMTTILTRFSSVGFGSTALLIFRQRHPTTLTVRTLGLEHGCLQR